LPAPVPGAGISVTLRFKPAAKEEHFGMAMEEGGMRQLRVTIPDGVEFADLCLSRDVNDTPSTKEQNCFSRCPRL
jgi:hypothetical protein